MYEPVLDDEFNEREERERIEQRVNRMINEGLQYTLDERSAGWSDNVIWENKVKPSNKLFYMLSALEMIKSYSNGKPIEEISSKFLYLSDDEFSKTMDILRDYFKQGKELATKLSELRISHKQTVSDSNKVTL